MRSETKRPRGKSRSKKVVLVSPNDNGVVTPPPPPPPPPPPLYRSAGGQLLTRLGDLQEKAYSALWPGYLPRGVVTVITGPQGAGKTALLAAAAAVQTAGNVGGLWEGPGTGYVLWHSVEDDPRAMLHPRLTAAGVDLSRVLLPDYDAAGRLQRKTCLPQDAEAIGDLAYSVGATLVVFDPLTSFLSPGFSPNDPLQVRTVMESLHVVAAQHDLCMLATLHPRKGRSGSPLEWVSGSGAWTQSARQVVLVDRHPDDTEMRLLSVLKPCCSLPCPSWRFQLRFDKGYPVVQLIATCDVRPEELAELGDLGELHERSEAIVWLREQLSEEREQGELYRRWQAQGYGTRLWWRCRRKLGVRVLRRGTQREQLTYLMLPPVDS